MDMIQTARMIEWLDDERRHDRALIAQLEERSNLQQNLLDQLRRHINELENELSTQRTQFMPLNRDKELLELFRNEVAQVMEAAEAKRIAGERDLERRQEIAREGLITLIHKLEEAQERQAEAVREALLFRSERDRLSSAISALQQRVDEVSKKLEDPERRLTLLEEYRRTDVRRLSEVQASLPDLSRAIESLLTKVDLLENLSKSSERRIIELQTAEAERRAEAQNFFDQQNLLSHQREQQMSDIRARINTHDEDMRRNMERFEAWSETHRQMKRIIEDFERISERLERRINEVAEMQRFSEERFRNEWNEWSDQDQFRWREFTVSNDEAWRLNAREIQELRATLKDTSERLLPLQKSLDRLWKLQRAQADLYRERYQALLLEYDRADDNPSTSSLAVVSPSNGTSNGAGIFSNGI
jgi:chromosome segregation ATPase